MKAFSLPVLLALVSCSTLVEREEEQEFAALASHVRAHPEDAEARLRLGDRLAVRGYGRGAIDVWEEGLRLSPGDLRFLRRIADGQYATGLEREAIASYERILAVAEPDPTLYYRLGWAALHVGESGKAFAAFEPYTRLQPRDAAGFVGAGLAQLRLSETKGEEYRLQLAEQSLQRAVLLDPGLVEARFNLALVYERKGWPKQAAAEYEELLRRKPDEAAALENLALLYIEDKNPAAAKPLLERALLVEKDPKLRRLVGEKLRAIEADLREN